MKNVQIIGIGLKYYGPNSTSFIQENILYWVRSFSAKNRKLVH